MKKKELSVLEKIGKELTLLDDTLSKMDDSKNKFNYYLEQISAIHEINTIIKRAKIVNAEEYKLEQKSNDTIQKIEERIDHLYKKLEVITPEDIKEASCLEQEKVLHEIRKMVYNQSK